MNFTNRFFIYAPFALFVLLATGLSVRWWVEASDFSKALDAANGRQVAPGIRLHFGSKRIAGFPFRLDAIFKDFRIDVATPHGPAIWQSEDFALHRLTYGRDQFIFEAAGRQRLRWTRDDGSTRALDLVVGSVRASAIENDSALSRADLAVVDIASKAFTARELQFHLRRDPAGNALDLFLTAGDVRLAAQNRSSFGDNLTALEFAATIARGDAFDGLRAGTMTWPAALDGWRHGGGSAHIDEFTASFGRFSATGTGNLAFDSNRRPEGILDFKVAGISQFLSVSAKRGVSGGSGKGLGPALLDRAAKGGSDDMGRIGAVLGFKDGVAYLGDEPTGMVAPLY
jgi:hypothetical protein